MSILILTIGISNSGKTTWAKEFCDKYGAVNINRDDLREELYGSLNTYKFKKAREAEVTKIQLIQASNAVSEGKEIIISDTNLSEKTRKMWEDFAKESDYTVVYELFFTEPHTCVARSLKRDYTVPPHVINAQYVRFRKFVTDNGYGNLPTYEPITSCQKALIFDVDGTLADMAGLRKPFDWDKVSLDKPRQSIVELARIYNDLGHKIIVMSGRDGVCYEDTLRWLDTHGVPVHKLYMRNKGDSRSDAIIKEELFWGHNLHRSYNIEFVVDDREQMCQRWRAMGLQCHQVANGNF